MTPDDELAAMERRWARNRARMRRAGAVTATCLLAAIALTVFATLAQEIGAVPGKLARPLSCSVGACAGGDQASHMAGPSFVADQLHSKMEGNCR